jgi:DNA-binding NarL/FixJ family response regulator
LGLSLRQLAFLHHVGQNKSRDEIAQVMGVAPSTIAAFAAQVKKRVGLQDLTEIARLAQGYIQARLSQLPLEGAVGPFSNAHAKAEAAKKDPRYAEAPFYLSPKLMEVFPLLASGASTKEVSEITGLSWTTVMGRKQSILAVTGSKTLFQAAQKARKAGLL